MPRPKQFHCPCCNYSACSSTDLRKHSKVHEEPSLENAMYICPKCANPPARFMTSGPFKRHLKNCHDLSDDQAEEICPTERRIFECPECRLQLANNFTLERHMVQHFSENDALPFQCPHCSYRCATMQRLSVHVSDAHGNTQGEDFHTIHQCPVDGCNYQTTHAHDLRLHEVIHGRDEAQFPLACDFCNARFARQEDLTKHKQHDHSPPNNKGKQPSGRAAPVPRNMMFRCPCKMLDGSPCPMSPRTSKQVYDHMRGLQFHQEILQDSNGKILLRCPECEYVGTASDVGKHYIKHSGERRFQCTQCDHPPYVDDKGLREHYERAHSDQRNYHCEKCNKSYATQSDLASHQKFFHPPEQIAADVPQEPVGTRSAPPTLVPEDLFQRTPFPGGSRSDPTSSILPPTEPAPSEDRKGKKRADAEISEPEEPPNQASTSEDRKGKRKAPARQQFYEKLPDGRWQCPFCPQTLSGSGPMETHRKAFHADKADVHIDTREHVEKEKPEPKRQKIELDENGKYPCRSCGKLHNTKSAMLKHERKCRHGQDPGAVQKPCKNEGCGLMIRADNMFVHRKHCGALSVEERQRHRQAVGTRRENKGDVEAQIHHRQIYHQDYHSTRMQNDEHYRDNRNRQQVEYYEAHKDDPEFMARKREKDRRADANPNRVAMKLGISVKRVREMQEEPCYLCGYHTSSGRRPLTQESRQNDSSWVAICGYCTNLGRARGQYNELSIAEVIRTAQNVAIARGSTLGRPRFDDSHSTYSRMCDSARRRENSVELTQSQYAALTAMECHYCHRPSGHSSNGLDRVSSDLPYTVDNVVSSCATCNFTKWRLSRLQFLQRCQAIAARHPPQ